MASKALITEFDNAKIVDYRDPKAPNNAIVITCEHASNALPDGYSWSEFDREHFANEHWGWDPAALDVAMYLASELKCVLVHSLYSRLLVDVNRDITSDTLFRKEGDGKEIELNKDLSEEEEKHRIYKYHFSYYTALREASEKVDPALIISVHSMTAVYEGKQRELEVGVLFTDSEKLGENVDKELQEKGYKSAQNEPYDGNILNAMNCILRANYPVRREAFCYEIRNDIIQDPIRAPQVKKDLLEVARKTCKIEEKINYMGF